MLELYVGCLIVGGGLVAASSLADHDASVDHDLDFTADHDLALDHVEGGDALWLPVLALRFWTFSIAFFGLTGTLFSVLERVGLVSGLGWGAVLGISLALGFVAGYTASRLVSSLRKERVDSNIDPDTDYVGHRGKILLRIEPGDPGTVRLNVKGVDVDLPARTHPDAEVATLERGAEVVVIEYHEGTLVVSPFQLEKEGEPSQPQRETA